MNIKPMTAAFVLFLLSSCSALQRNQFELKNETGRELKDVNISFGDAVVRRPSLGPGETFSFHPSPDRDGGVRVSYLESGKRIEHKLGYVAPPISMTCKFVIISTDVRGECTENGII